MWAWTAFTWSPSQHPQLRAQPSVVSPTQTPLASRKPSPALLTRGLCMGGFPAPSWGSTSQWQGRAQRKAWSAVLVREVNGHQMLEARDREGAWSWSAHLHRPSPHPCSGCQGNGCELGTLERRQHADQHLWGQTWHPGASRAGSLRQQPPLGRATEGRVALGTWRPWLPPGSVFMALAFILDLHSCFGWAASSFITLCLQG